MKILVVCQYYPPEPFRIGDICEALVSHGHQVTVVTGTPNYPMGQIYPGYEGNAHREETLNGVHILRCPIAPRKTGTLNRLRNYFSFPAASAKAVGKLPGDFDVVFVNQLSPVMMAKAGIDYKKKHGKKLVLYCLDLWPESLCVGGITRNSPIYKVFHGISRRIYRSADEILITSRSFREYLRQQFAVKDEAVRYLPQYAEDQFLSLPEKEPGEEFHLVFAGNMGAAQNLDTVLDAAERLKAENIVFHMVGDGVELERLQTRGKDLPKVIFHGRRPLEEMPRFYAMADAMLVTLTDDPVVSLTLPGKVQSYMAAGKPVLGAINGETALVLQEAQGGFCGPAGDGEALADNIRSLMASGKAPEIGRANRAYYKEKFSRESFIDQLIASLERNQ